VAYDGTAEDPGAWLAHHIAHHTPLMTRLPAVREVEVYMRRNCCSFLPWPKVDHPQRNKVVFDDAGALRAALNFPVRHEMPADFHQFPPFPGAGAALSHGHPAARSRRVKTALITETRMPPTAIAHTKHPTISAEEWQARIDLAACCRLVALYGRDDIVYTHISARVQGTEDQFLINPGLPLPTRRGAA
jgi:hypothetical protein